MSTDRPLELVEGVQKSCGLCANFHFTESILWKWENFAPNTLFMGVHHHDCVLTHWGQDKMAVMLQMTF